MPKPCRFCGQEIDFIVDTRGKWRAVRSDWVGPELPNTDTLLAALDEDGNWHQLKPKELRAYQAHACGRRIGWGPRPADVGVVSPPDDAPPPEPPPVIECEECGGEHVEGGPHQMCACGRYQTVSFGSCEVCLDVGLSPDPKRYPKGQLASACGQCGAQPGKACVLASGYAAAVPHPKRRSPVLWTTDDNPLPLVPADIEAERAQRRVDVRQLRDWLWDHGDVLWG